MTTPLKGQASGANSLSVKCLFDYGDTSKDCRPALSVSDSRCARTTVTFGNPRLIPGHRLQKLQAFFTRNIAVSTGFMKFQKTPNTIEPVKYL